LIGEMIRRYRETRDLSNTRGLRVEMHLSQLRLAIDRQPEPIRTILMKKADSVL